MESNILQPPKSTSGMVTMKDENDAISPFLQLIVQKKITSEVVTVGDENAAAAVSDILKVTSPKKYTMATATQ